MLENRRAPIFCAWLRSRRASKSAALLTRLVLRGLGVVSGRGASRHIDARSLRGVERGAWFRKPPFRTERSSGRRKVTNASTRSRAPSARSISIAPGRSSLRGRCDAAACNDVPAANTAEGPVMTADEPSSGRPTTPIGMNSQAPLEGSDG